MILNRLSIVLVLLLLRTNVSNYIICKTRTVYMLGLTFSSISKLKPTMYTLVPHTIATHIPNRHNNLLANMFAAPSPFVNNWRCLTWHRFQPHHFQAGCHIPLLAPTFLLAMRQWKLCRPSPGTRNSIYYALTQSRHWHEPNNKTNDCAS